MLHTHFKLHLLKLCCVLFLSKDNDFTMFACRQNWIVNGGIAFLGSKDEEKKGRPTAILRGTRSGVTRRHRLISVVLDRTQPSSPLPENFGGILPFLGPVPSSRPLVLLSARVRSRRLLTALRGCERSVKIKLKIKKTYCEI